MIPKVYVVFWRLIELTGLVAALVGLWIAIEGNRLARQEAEAGRIVNAWQILNTQVPGSSGKKEALENLIAAGIDLNGIDLSCEKMGGGWETEFKHCINPVYLSKLNRNTHDAGNPARLESANFQGAHLNESILVGADLTSANFTGAQLWSVVFTSANLQSADLSHAQLELADLMKADLTEARLASANVLETNFDGANLKDANISHARFCGYVNRDNGTFPVCTQSISQEQIDSTWSWDDQPPVLSITTDDGSTLSTSLNPPPTCPADLRPQEGAPQLWGKPEEC